MRTRGRRALLMAILAGVVLALFLPAAPPPVLANPHRTPFRWRENPRWFGLEARFRQLRLAGCAQITARIDAELRRGRRFIDVVESRAWDVQAPVFDSVESNTFDLGPMIGVCTGRLPDYIRLINRSRSAVKRQSQRWDIAAQATKDRMYRLLYGGRAALEEVMLQDSAAARPALVLADDEPSQTPYTRILGATIHSGDLLVSRGGAQVSALIAVGNDYPGNFSHVAIVHVDEHSSLASVIESRPGTGVAVHRLDDYLADVKLRIMILRLRADLPVLVADPMLPHKAAIRAMDEARRRHIPYDFEMDQYDPARMYCSEVVSSAYAKVGVTLWMGLSSISSPGVFSWLSGMGVRQFEAQQPSDLEYDPQVRVVAEWRNPETLFMDHVDNVVTEAMLQGAERGETLRYPWYLLPQARVAKLYSVVAHALGFHSPIPEGLATDPALQILTFNVIHNAIKRHVLLEADAFRRQQAYVAPEWQLLRFAKQATEDYRSYRAYLAALRQEL